ncbi:hypothetical protein [Ruminiclostridium cellobioparum]|uniref:hypothetical protein n=1 Tax=Ruminiclostridium cellobioparum TaxID=29355 RepID=UPI0006844016|nr:hypothetical protein [Ruminiclostridium cellobioparum]
MNKKGFNFKTDYKLRTKASTITTFKLKSLRQFSFNSVAYSTLQETFNALRSTKQVSVNGVYYTTLQEAINSVSTSKETLITLHSDIKLFNRNIYICQNQNIVIDLAGYNISSYNGDGTIYLEGSLTVLDSSSTRSGFIENTYSNGIGIYFYHSGALNLYGGTIKASCSLYSWNEYYSPRVIIDGGTIESKCFGVFIRNIENLKIRRGIIRGGVSSFDTGD